FGGILDGEALEQSNRFAQRSPDLSRRLVGPIALELPQRFAVEALAIGCRVPLLGRLEHRREPRLGRVGNRERLRPAATTQARRDDEPDGPPSGHKRLHRFSSRKMLKSTSSSDPISSLVRSLPSTLVMASKYSRVETSAGACSYWPRSRSKRSVSPSAPSTAR